MSDSRRLLGFGLVLAATLAAGYGLGVVVGPIGDSPASQMTAIEEEAHP